ncbi:hypothetical protein GF337_13520 [candidate division KSB1 bacterium]|nr:hypothetical protein [candidate division KSB1 bacterium]
MNKHPVFFFPLMFILFCLNIQSITAQTHYFGTLSNVKQRPLAMGGAFTSVEDDLEAVLYNPGSFNLYENEKQHRLTIFINPMSLLIASRHYSENFTEKIENTNVLNASALLFKSVIFTAKFFNAGIILGEESLNNIRQNERSSFFSFNDLWNNCSHTIFSNIQLAPKVSMGLSGTVYYDKTGSTRISKYGFSYGILMKPNPHINVGLSYIDFPKELPNYRTNLERMFDETMNIGISYRPFPGTTLSVDVRNLTEENKNNVRELHVGFEQSFFGIISLQGGYFQENYTKNNSYSCGIGLFDSRLIHKRQNEFGHHNYSLQYSFVYQEEEKGFNRWHFFSLLFHL